MTIIKLVNLDYVLKHLRENLGLDLKAKYPGAWGTTLVKGYIADDGLLHAQVVMLKPGTSDPMETWTIRVNIKGRLVNTTWS